jgi:uncharacterized protein Smg (DUF494 family)
MSYNLRDVALLLLDRLEAFLGGEAGALEELKEGLAGAGVGPDLVHAALAWLRAGATGEPEEMVPAETPADPRRRVLSREERRVLPPEAFGFLLRLAADGRLEAEQLESILARLGEHEFPVELEDVQELAWRVATGGDGGESESESDFGASEDTVH